MSIEECIKVSARSEDIPQDKFDKHMRKAREEDLSSRKSTFVRHTEHGVQAKESVADLKTSIY